MALRRPSETNSDTGLLRAIAIFKFVKAAVLIAAGVGALKLVHADVGAVLETWVWKLNLDPGSHLLSSAIQKAANLPPHKFREVGIGGFVYAGLFLTEGTGLWLRKRWGEWFTVIITSSLLPIEVWELVRHPTAIKGLVFLVNIAVVVYLVYHIRHHPQPAPSRKQANA